ncbi:MAG TPA: AAA domain-containing protein, partial [Candidatus Wallbacteria bacterium]|nr:AAA domain-containing protein [Candidatus Wallbacteria bacterium]
MNGQTLKKLEEIKEARLEWIESSKRNNFNFDAILSGLYKDASHFIFEIIQNAEDAGASRIEFYLKESGLEIIHNGRNFTIEDIDSVTSIGNSTKKEDINAIGKFGVGFKSVYAVTSTPVIKSGEFDITIKDFVLPQINLYKEKHKDTRIILEFKHKFRSAAEIYEKTRSRLEAFEMETLLFLNSIKEIKIDYENDYKIYSKTVKNYNKNRKGYFLVKLSGDVSESYLLAVRLFEIDGKQLETKVALKVRYDETGSLELVPAAKSSKLTVFFPTNEETYMRCLIHAPFKTTPSRDNVPFNDAQNIKITENVGDHLKELISFAKEEKLLKLDFLNILPLSYSKRSSNDFYKTLFDMIKDYLKTAAVWPLEKGCYGFGLAGDCLIARDHELIDYLESVDLRTLFNKKNWLSRDISAERNQELRKYALTETGLIEVRWEDVLKKSSPAFFSRQSDEWLIKLCLAMSEKPALFGALKKTAFVKNEDGKHIIAFNESGGPLVFLKPSDSRIYDGNYQFVHRKITENSDAVDFLKRLGLRTPDLVDEVKNITICAYKQVRDYFEIDEDDYENDLRKTAEALYKAQGEDHDQIIELLKNYDFILARCGANEQRYLIRPSAAYLYNENVICYLSCFKNKNLYYIDERVYEIFEEHGIKKDKFEQILIKAGAREFPVKPVEYYSAKGEITEGVLSDEERLRLREIQAGGFAGLEKIGVEIIKDNQILWLEEILENINIDRSAGLWNLLCELGRYYNKSSYEWKPADKTRGFFNKINIEAGFIKTLKNVRWLFDKTGALVSPRDISVMNLAHEYRINLKNEKITKLIGALEFKSEPIDILMSMLTDDEKKAYVIAQKLFAEKIDEYAIESYVKSKMESGGIFDETLQGPVDVTAENMAVDGSLNAVVSGKLKDKLSDEQLENLIDELKQKAAGLEKYTYEWFLCSIEHEYYINLKYSKTKEITIYFYKIEKHGDSFIILRDASPYIPYNIEDMGDLELKLYSRGGVERKIKIEVVSNRESAIKIKLSDHTQFACVNPDEISYAKLEIKNLLFILESLYECFLALNFDKAANLKDLIPSGLNFIYGPPGTGKTTFIASDIIKKVGDAGRRPLKLLALAPTNKAADVLTARIIEKCNGKAPDWLTRFGTTGDKSIEASGAVRGKEFNIFNPWPDVVITTIARFSYDRFKDFALKDFKWDYIIIDEASMVMLPAIIYVILRRSDDVKKIMIAGDPMQIQPIVRAESLVEQNIYSMAGLKEFTPETFPASHEVIMLKKQYRSAREIGTIFSEYAYNGLLEHARGDNLDLIELNKTILKSVSVLKCPFDGAQNIYQPKQVESSSYQVYSLLFLFEFIRHLVKIIDGEWRIKKEVIKNAAGVAGKKALKNGADFEINNIEASIEEGVDDFNIEELNEKRWTIGIISPYKAQALALEKLFGSIGPLSNKVSIISGTVHGFQGDECDIIFAVMNMPKRLGPRSFINNRNILNVAISRAKNYLIILTPDEQTYGYAKLSELQAILKIIE